MKQKDINNLSSRPRIIYGDHERKQTHGKQAWRIAVVRELAFHQCDLSSDNMCSVHGSFSCSESSFSPVTPVSSSLRKLKISNSNTPFETMTYFLLIKTGIHFGLSFMFKFGNPSEV